MKAYGGWGGGITPCIINFGTISRWVISYMPQLHCLEISPDRHWVGHHVGPRARLDVLCKNICCPYWEANHSSSVVQHLCYLQSWLLLHLPCIFWYFATEAVLLDTLVCPTTQCQYSYFVCIFSGLQHYAYIHKCWCAEFCCIVWWEHMQRSYTIDLSQNSWYCVEKGYTAVGIPGSCRSLWKKLMLPVFLPLF